ncbi:MAG: FecR domain-containing protein [bacterium]
MARLSFFIVIIFLAETLFSADYFDRGAKIKLFIGRVEISKAKNWIPAKIGMKLKSKDRIRTFVESSLELETPEGTIIKIHESTTFELTDILEKRRNHDQKTTCRVLTGSVWANVKKLGSKRSDFVFETPTAVAAIRGTELDLTVERGKTKIRVFKGIVFVAPRGSRAGANVKANQMVLVVKGQKSVQVQNMTAEEAKNKIAVIDTASVPDTSAVDTTVDTTGTDTSAIDSIKDTTVVDSAGIDSIKDTTATAIDSVLPDTDTDTASVDTAYEHPPLDTAVSDTARTDTAVITDSLMDTTSSVNIPADTADNVIDHDTIAAEQPADTGQEMEDTLFQDITALTDSIIAETAGTEDTIKDQEEAVPSAEKPETLSVAKLETTKDTTWLPEPEAPEKMQAKEEDLSQICNLRVTGPRDDQQFSSTIIDVKGTTGCPNKDITVNNYRTRSDGSGSFYYQLAIPDECNPNIPIEVCLDGDCRTMAVSYAPPCTDISLKLASPSGGKTFFKGNIPIVINTEASKVLLNGKPLQGGAGTFSRQILINDRASRDDMELTSIIVEAEKTCCTGETKEAAAEASITIQPDLTDKSVNTYQPEIDAIKLPTKYRVSVRDNTAKVFDDEEILLSYSSSTGESDVFTLSQNERIDINLLDGRNIIYTFTAADKAGNTAKFVSPAVSFLSELPKIQMVNPPRQGDYILVKRRPPDHPGRINPTNFTLQFRINVPGDDYNLIEKVIIVVKKKTGTLLNLTYNAGQINNTDFDIDLEFDWKPDTYTYTINAESFNGIRAKEVSGRIRVGE